MSTPPARRADERAPRTPGASRGDLRRPDPNATGFVIRPSVSITMPYVSAICKVSMFVLAAARWPTAGRPPSVISAGTLAALTVVNVGLATLLVADGISIRNYAPCLRRPLLAGVIAAIAVLTLLQFGLILAYDPSLFR